MPPNNLRSVSALRRNFSTGSSHNSRNIYVTKAARLLTRVSGLTVGAGLGYLLFGDVANVLEKERQRHMREFFWFPLKTEDLTEKMWPELKELREKMWFHSMEKMWSDLGDKMFSDRKS